MEHMGSDKLYFYLLTTISPPDFFVQTFLPEGGGSFWGGSEDSHDHFSLKLLGVHFLSFFVEHVGVKFMQKVAFSKPLFTHDIS